MFKAQDRRPEIARAINTLPSLLQTRYWRLYRAMSASLVEAFCCSHPLLNSGLRLACLPFALELTRLGMKMEDMIALDGDLKRASHWLIDIGARDLRIHHAERVPRQGPLLFLGNHGGLGDANALLAASPRRDTHIMAYNFGILPGLEAMHRHVIVVDRANPGGALRQGLRHLRSGQSLLLYPRGEIEADPGLYLEEALSSLRHWSGSIDFYARHVPGLAILPFAAGGFISRKALRNPIVRRYREADKRRFLAATFQMMFARYRDPVISLAFGRPLRNEAATRANALRQMEELLSRVHAEQQAVMAQS